jgi:hypothetical protein
MFGIFKDKEGKVPIEQYSFYVENLTDSGLSLSVRGLNTVNQPKRENFFSCTKDNITYEARKVIRGRIGKFYNDEQVCYF